MFLKAQMPDHHLLNGLFSHGGREKYPHAALNWVLAVPNLIHTYIHTYIHREYLLNQFSININQVFNVSIYQQFIKITPKILDTEKSGLSSQTF